MSDLGLAAATNSMLDKALATSGPVVVRFIEQSRRMRPDASPEALLRSLEKSFLAAMTAQGALAGGAAAAPGVGLPAGLGLAVVDGASFLQAAVVLTLAEAEIHGVPLQDLENRRALVLAVLLGDSGATIFKQMAGRTGKHWGKAVANGVPKGTIRAINRVLGHNFVTRYGTKQGILVLGKACPLGIGAGIGATGNHLMARGIVRALHNAFGSAPGDWSGSAPKPTPMSPRQPCYAA